MNIDVTFHRPTSRFGLMSIYGVIGVIGLLVARFIPVARIFSPWWGCPFRQFTGIPCPGCGLTRAFDWETHGHIGRAFVLTPVGAMLPLVTFVVAAWGIAVLAVRAPLPEVKIDRTVGQLLRWGALAAFLGNWLYMVLTRTHA